MIRIGIDNNLINELRCNIKSNSYSDLMNIKSKIINLSQFKSMNLQTISYNNNIEKIQFYGDFLFFSKSLLLDKIEIDINEGCIISNIEK